MRTYLVLLLPGLGSCIHTEMSKQEMCEWTRTHRYYYYLEHCESEKPRDLDSDEPKLELPRPPTKW